MDNRMERIVSEFTFTFRANRLGHSLTRLGPDLLLLASIFIHHQAATLATPAGHSHFISVISLKILNMFRDNHERFIGVVTSELGNFILEWHPLLSAEVSDPKIRHQLRREHSKLS